jgi:RNA recognition motif-containing protein
MKNLEIKPSNELAYWTGVVQSDGYLDVYHCKNRNRTYYRISIDTSSKSLPMVKKFRKISNQHLGRNVKIFECKNDVFKCTVGVKKLLPLFKELDIKFSDPQIPPNWTLSTIQFFGAYLAGVIDGDGNINVRKRRNKCVITIFSKNKPVHLLEAIKTMFSCGGHISFKNRCYHTQFEISRKNYQFVKNFILPHLAIMRKREKLENFINSKYSGSSAS